MLNIKNSGFSFYFFRYLISFFLCFGISHHALAVEDSKPVLDTPMLEDYAGRAVLLDFWASWCGPCRQSFSWMNEIKDKYPNLTIVAVNLDEDTDLAKQFLSANPVNFDVIYDPDGRLAERFDIQGMPSSYLIDPSGYIVSQHVGFFSDKTGIYENKIESMLSLKAAGNF